MKQNKNRIRIKIGLKPCFPDIFIVSCNTNTVFWRDVVFFIRGASSVVENERFVLRLWSHRNQKISSSEEHERDPQISWQSV